MDEIRDDRSPQLPRRTTGDEPTGLEPALPGAIDACTTIQIVVSYTDILMRRPIPGLEMTPETSVIRHRQAVSALCRLRDEAGGLCRAYAGASLPEGRWMNSVADALIRRLKIEMPGFDPSLIPEPAEGHRYSNRAKLA